MATPILSLSIPWVVVMADTNFLCEDCWSIIGHPPPWKGKHRSNWALPWFKWFSLPGQIEISSFPWRNSLTPAEPTRPSWVLLLDILINIEDCYGQLASATSFLLKECTVPIQHVLDFQRLLQRTLRNFHSGSDTAWTSRIQFNLLQNTVRDREWFLSRRTNFLRSLNTFQIK